MNRHLPPIRHIPVILIVLWARCLHAQPSTIVLPEYGPMQKRTSTILPTKTFKEPKVALVLSGGAARGLAHIGVLKSLEKHGIPINLIIGTSMGSIVGGLYASGYSPAELQAIADTVNWSDVLSFSDEARRSDLFLDQRQAEERSFLTIRFKDFQPIIPSSFSTGQRLTKFLNGLLLKAVYHPDSSFDELKVPFRAVTTDLISGRQIILSQGDLTEALRASTTIPLLFSPVSRDSTLLLDGGLISNIPVDVAQKFGADIIIAVNVTSGVRNGNEVQKPWEMADQIMSIMMQVPNQLQLGKADVAITPLIGDRSSSDFSGVDSLIDAGERAADSAIAAIKQKIRTVHTSTTIDDAPLSNVKIKFQGDLGSLPALQKTLLQQIYNGEISQFSIRRQLHFLYASGDYSDVRAEIQHGDSTTVVTFQATLNPRLTGVEFLNNTIIPSDTLLIPFISLKGKIINTRESTAALEKVIEIYRLHGYALARIDSISFDTQTGIASIRIDEGRIIDRRIEGNLKTKLFVVFREVSLNEGEPFTIDRAIQSITNVMSTNLFEQVMLLVRYENKKPVLIIKVQERSSEILQLGVHVDNERGLQFFVDGRDANFLGTATEFGATFIGGIRNQIYKLEYKSNRIFNTYLSFNLSGYYRFKDINTYSDELGLPSTRWNRIQTGEYREIKYGSAFSFGAQLERLGNVSVEGRYEQHEILDKSGTALTAGYTPSRYRVSALRIASTVDTQDKYPFPTNGILMTLFYEFATRTLGSEVPYTKLFLSYEQFRTPGKHLTIHPRVMFGFGDETLPLSEQFTFGGQRLFNGLRDEDGRGRQIFLINLEARWLSPVSLLFNTYLSIRYDLGSVWRMAEDIRFKDFQHGLGITLALDTPIGPAEFGLGRSFIFRRDLPDNPVSLGPFQIYATIGCRL